MQIVIDDNVDGTEFLIKIKEVLYNKFKIVHSILQITPRSKAKKIVNCEHCN